MENTNVLELKWGTSNPVQYNDSKYGNIELNFIGVCHYKISNTNVDSKSLEQQLYQNIVSCINIIVGSISGELYLNISSIVSEKLPTMLVSNVNNLGIVIQDINITSMDLTPASLDKKHEIDKKLMLEKQKNNVTVVQTDVGAKDGQNKCPKCGATDISLNVNNGHLRCNFCRHEFEPEKVEGLQTDISQLQGKIMGSGTQDIIADVSDVLTFKCSSCGAEVVIDTASAMQARCHWCRNTLSVNQQIPNGSVPDVVLPFQVKKEDARLQIENFVGKRKFFAHPKFKQEFTTQNIMGVYLPYMVVDVNSHAAFAGQGEHLVRTYTRGSGDNRRTYYDADLYNVEREFDLVINGLTVESSADKLNNKSSNKTNNVINAIMPFDIENCVKYNANYLKGYTSEKRDANVEHLQALVEAQAKDVARFAANDTLKEYDRGVAWSNEQLQIKGQQWKAAYLPVWLYSYQQVSGNKKVLHYVAVNARTKETMGSVPIHMPKLLLVSFLVEILGFMAMISIDFDYNWLFLALGFVFYFLMYARYRNNNARHSHETETKKQMANIRKVDEFVKRRTGLSNSTMQGANNKNINGKGINDKILSNINGKK